MKVTPKKGLEAITVRRAKLADADKVRYRVYRTPTDFVAVIAESALMAVKVAGVSRPHKIVRDLPHEGGAISAKKMAPSEAKPERVILPVARTEAPGPLVAELPSRPKEAVQEQEAFTPIALGDLERHEAPRMRILPPDLLSQIIEEHAKASLPPAPVSESPDEAAAVPLASPPELELSAQERLMKAAEEAFVGSAEAARADRPELSPDEVERLLNGG